MRNEGRLMKSISKYRGCLIGGAVGDALGYAVEFYSEKDIRQKYGKGGVAEYELTNGVAVISDDTQMTLFTASGLLLGTTRGMTNGVMAPYPEYIGLCYQDWYQTQQSGILGLKEPEDSWLGNIPELHRRRAPGLTCLNALKDGQLGSVAQPANRSKGCGGVMRVAPIGLYFADNRLSADEIDRKAQRQPR